MGPIPSVPIDPFDLAFLEDPYPRHDELRDAGPVVWLEAIGAYGMARYAEVQSALNDWQTFSSARGVGLADFSKEEPWRPPSLLLETDPPAHERTRRIMNRIVTVPALKRIRDAWAAKAETLVASLAERKTFDAVTELAEVFPMRVFPDMIGLPVEGREHLLPYAVMTFNGFGPRNALFAESMAKGARATEWVNGVCKRDRMIPGGWGTLVFEAADRGECTEAEAERLVRSFLSAGIDTTVNGIGTLIQAFSEHPEQWQLLRSDRTLARKAFEESLRWNSTVQIFFRTTTADVEISDAPIPKGSKVLLFLAAANRDPRRWGDATVFDITRHASGHVGFGFGIHQCLGQMVARLEADVVLQAMLDHFPKIERAGPPVRRLNNTLSALGSLPISVV